MAPDRLIFSLVLHKMWSINEPQYASENKVDVEFSAHVAFLE
jgi:hypothetical protein